MSLTFTLLTWPLSSFQIISLSYFSVLCLAFLHFFPLLCYLPFFLVCSAFAFSETHKKETSGSFTKNHTCATDHHISICLRWIICCDATVFVARSFLPFLQSLVCFFNVFCLVGTLVLFLLLISHKQVGNTVLLDITSLLFLPLTLENANLCSFWWEYVTLGVSQLFAFKVLFSGSFEKWIWSKAINS